MEEITEEALDHFYHLHAQKKEMERAQAVINDIYENGLIE